MKILIVSLAVVASLSCLSCRKTFLDAKPDESLVVPASLKDLQALLDNDRFMNGSSTQAIGGPNPALLVTGADEYYATDDNFETFSLYSKNVYTWAKDDVYGGAAQVSDWAAPYRTVFYANTALEGLEKITAATGTAAWNNIKGSALFYRAYSFYQLAQVFAPPYDKVTAASDLGIPLRLEADINEPVSRATVAQTYNRIIEDLHTASPLLPQTPLYKTRPSAPAVLALLARVFQTMELYDSAFLYADSCLKMVNGLFDYNGVDAAATYPLLKNSEVIFTSVINTLPSTELWSSSKARIDSTLYNSYAANDLRKSLYFRLREPGKYSFRGSYEGSGFLFTGLAVNELYLVRAECYARKGNTAAAMNDLNTLLQKRWKTGTFVQLAAANAGEALTMVLEERKKELLMRSLRWMDLRRLNKDSRFAKTLVRRVKGQTYTLPPGDLRYTWPIPGDVIGFHPSMPQNPR